MELAVNVYKDGAGFAAQGVEIDYCAGAKTIEKVKDSFNRGLRLTMEAHLERFGNLDNLLKPTPATILREYEPNKLETYQLTLDCQ